MIPKSVKERVWARDDFRCVGCGRWAPVDWACAHYIARSHGGLGIEKNILTLCPRCHEAYDNGPNRGELKETYGRYLKAHYGELTGLVYRKDDL